LKHTRKHERRRKESNQRTKLSASGGLSGQVGRTVRKGHADSPARCRGQSARDADRPAGGHGLSVKDNTTTRTDPRMTDRPRRSGGPSARIPDRPLLKLGPSANRLQRKPKTKPDRKQRRARTRRTREEHGAHGPSAPHGQSRKQLDPEGQLSQSITRSPKR
jgi:hypothetical protein